jgi:hypothetical protein
MLHVSHLGSLGRLAATAVWIVVAVQSLAFGGEDPPPPAAPSAPPPPAAEPPVVASRTVEIEKLVSDLADKSFAIREGATRKLMKVGEEAVPALEKARASTDSDTRDRAEFILRKIREQSSEARKEKKPRPGGVSAGDLKRMEIELREMKEQIDQLRRSLEGQGPARPRRLYRSLPDDEFQEIGPGFPGQNLPGQSLPGQPGRGFPPVARGNAPGDEESRGKSLGARVREMDPALAAQLRLESGQGVVVEQVVDGSPAAAAGIKAHDVLLLLDGKSISGTGPTGAVEALIHAVGSSPLGKPVAVEVIRGGEKTRLEVTFKAKERPAEGGARRA